MELHYLTAQQVAEMLQLNVESIYDLAGRGEIPASKICGRWRFEAGEIHEWFRSIRTPAHQRQIGRGAIVALGFAALVSTLVASPAGAAVFTLTSTADEVDVVPGDGTCATSGAQCTMRAAVQEANAWPGADTIQVPPGTYTLTIPGNGEDSAVSGDLDITGSLTINGTGATATVVDGGTLDRVFEIYTPFCTIRGLTVQNGLFSGEGGGIRVHGSNSLVMENAAVVNNAAPDKAGGGIKVSSGTLTLTNVTVSGNSSKDSPGIFNQSATLNLTNVTVANNSGTGKGAFNPGSGTLTIVNLLVAGNVGVPDCDKDSGPAPNSLDSDGTCGFGLTAAPLLGPLQDNGGPTLTHELLAGSPAVDTGTNGGCPLTDQRGTTRPLDGDGDTIATCDIGAYERQGTNISGSVYHDIDASGSFDPGELGVGAVWVKLVSGGSVIRVVQADPDSGAYTIAGVADGSYTVIVDDNGNAVDAVPGEPVNWLFQNPAGGSLPVTVAGADVTGRDFGFSYDFDLAADCACGYDDGLLTQRTITIDGEMSDWGAVLADGDNNACDATDATDRDHPVPSSGRNLVRTAVTFDGSYFALWSERIGSSNNVQNFIYYADTNVDGVMQAGEPVVASTWNGTTGAVVLELYTYDDLGSGGDSLLDGSGYADGYSMPGDLVLVKTLSLPDGAGQGSTGGAADGLQMEWKIAWSELGLAPGAALGWHVGTTGSSPGSANLSSKIDDNLGGCGGQCAGSNQFSGVQGAPGTGPPGQTIYVPHSFTNTGNAVDLFDLTWNSSGAFIPASVALYRDLGTVGQYDPGVDTLIVDSDSDSDPDTGTLAAGASFDMLVAIELPGPPAVGAATVTTMATSNLLPGCGGTLTPIAGSIDDVVEISYQITGTVFEDVNYGGGLGRDLAAASADAPSFAVGRGNVTVELYDAAGNFIAVTTTAVVDGSYLFTGLGITIYTVRVVNSTVTSSRPGSDGSELGVQTYRIDGDGESLGTGARAVGGQLPSGEDAAANSGIQTLAALQGTDLDADGVTELTQSIVTVDAASGDVSGVDFGFNFDVVVNTNDAGQGTLRQFILNSNLLN